MDLVADNLVSCMVIIDGGFWGLVIRYCRHDMIVFSEEAFHVIAHHSWLVIGSGPFGGGKFCVRGGSG